MHFRGFGSHRYFTRSRANQQWEEEENPMLDFGNIAEQRNDGGNGQPSLQDIMAQMARQQQQMMQMFMQS